MRKIFFPTLIGFFVLTSILRCTKDGHSVVTPPPPPPPPGSVNHAKVIPETVKENPQIKKINTRALQRQ